MKINLLKKFTDTVPYSQVCSKVQKEWDQ